MKNDMTGKARLAPLLATMIMTMLFSAAEAAESFKVMFLSKRHCMVRVDAGRRYVMLPVEEKAGISNVKVIAGNETVRTFNVRMAVDNIDYYVPLDVSAYAGKGLVLDFHVDTDARQEGDIREHLCWSKMLAADSAGTANRERFRPVYHHTPVYGWMNDPNGMFHKDGVYHLYYQHNPFGSQWENMTWGHSSSTDLVNWTDHGDAIMPDGLGTIFSGCCVVDKDNTSGFGRGAVVAFYTSAGESQTQSMAYSTDNGKTFVKYEGNPVLTSDVPDFRDPHVFFHEPSGRWIMILAAGQEMRIYSSADLKAWNYESSFGEGYGSHGGVWECPDLFELPVEGKDYSKWVLLCNINPGGPAGGSATQYFTGTFDGHKFTCDTSPGVTKWADYGKDHYATVTFDNAPGGRRIALGWMSNWQYAAQVPTLQYRSANTIARDLFLFSAAGTEYLGSRPSEENNAMRGKPAVSRQSPASAREVKKMFASPRGACEVVVKLAPGKDSSVKLVLSNGKEESVTVTYDTAARTLSMDRRKSGDVSFSEFFPVETVAPVHGGPLTELRLYVDNSSIELFGNGGQVVMTNIVFPSEPYNSLSVKCGRRSKVTGLTVYPLNK